MKKMEVWVQTKINKQDNIRVTGFVLPVENGVKHYLWVSNTQCPLV